MLDGLKNSFNNTVDTGRRASDEIIGMAKEIKEMPLKNLKPIQIAYIVFGILAFAIIAFVIIPLIN